MRWESLWFFLFGFVVCAFLFFYFSFNLDTPLTISGFGIRDLEFGKVGVVSAPSDWIKEDDIIILDDRVILKIKGVTLSNYVDSGSMVPVLDKGANGIRIVPVSEIEIKVGDIVSFRIGGVLVVHRIIEKGDDDDGVYFVVKGDSNLVGDGKIRFEDIEYKTIGILY